MNTADGRMYQRTLVTAISAEIGARGWSRNELARRSGISIQQVQRIMSLKRDMTVSQLGAIIEAIDVTPEYLVAEARRRAQADQPASSATTAPPVTRLTRADVEGFLAAPHTDETLNSQKSEARSVSSATGDELTGLLERIERLRRAELLSLLGELDRRNHNHGA